MTLPDPRRPLEASAAADIFARILDGQVEDAELAQFLTKLADRGETADEVAAAARALRSRQLTPFNASEAVDVVGTGGDGKHSLNVSTATAIVLAACGVPVAKHGNRAASSRSGAADVLTALGLPELPVERLETCYRETGIVFLHAARHHPAMARVAAVRRALGRRTIFNLLGPLANPAGARRQLVGVFAPRWLKPMAEALRTLGSERAMIVHGDGFDELTVSGDSRFALLASGLVAEGGATPELVGVSRHAPQALTGGDADYNAGRLKGLLAGERSAYRDIVVLNTAAALIVADPAEDWVSGAARATAALDSGAAADLLARWVAFR